MNILIIEDDQITSKYLQKGLREAGYGTNTANSGIQGRDEAMTNDYDLIILDLMLPVLNGFEVLESLRKENIKTPVIILSAKSDLDDRVKGLRSGSDDYLTKPFSFTELLARIEAILRRASNIQDETSFVSSNLRLNILSHKVYISNVQVNLQPLEFNLLSYLIRNKGRVVSKTMITENVWDFNFDPESNIVESRISRLRTKLAKHGSTCDIKTIRGFGYMIDDK